MGSGASKSLLPLDAGDAEAVMVRAVEVALSTTINNAVTANVAWAQHPPSISEVLRSVGNTLITNANTHETTLLPAESVPQPEDEPETADVLSSQHIAPVLPIASEYKQLLSVRVSPRTTPAFRTG